MDSYLQQQAYLAGDFPGFGPLARLYSNWQAKKDVVKLLKLDDYILRDLGLSRRDIEWAANLPLTSNAAMALEERRVWR